MNNRARLRAFIRPAFAGAALIMIASIMHPIFAVGAGRPIVVPGGTVLTADRKPLRGTPLNIYKGNPPAVNAWGLDINNLRKARDEAHYNAFRICLMDGQDYTYHWQSGHYGVNEVLSLYVDSIIKNAEALGGIYIIVDFHVPQWNFGCNCEWAADSFWLKVTPRYKDYPFVIYEMLNEGSGPAAPGDWVLDGGVRIAKNWHAVAPNTVVLHGSPAEIGGVDKNVQDNGAWGPFLVRYAKAAGFSWSSGRDAFGFHGYGSWLNPDVMKTIQSYGIAIMMTEVGYVGAEWPGYSLNGYKQQFEWYERNGVSWIDWHDWWKTDPLQNAMNIGIPDALAKGYAWWLQAAAQPLPNGYRDNGISHTSRPGHGFDSMGRCIVYPGDKGRRAPLTPSHTIGKLTKTR